MDLTSFKLDIDELLDDCTKGELTTLADMKRKWAAKKFSYLYEARPTTNSAFFMQSLFAHTIGHMVSEAVLSRRLGGLYCLYCLYETQPYKPRFKIYLSLDVRLYSVFCSRYLFGLFPATGELKRLKILVIDAKQNGIGVIPALVKRMLDKNMFLFGAVDIAGGSITQSVDDMMKLQNKRVQIAYEKLLSNTRIEDYVHMDLGAEFDLQALKKMSTEYEKAKESAVKEASGTVDVEDIKHIAENKKPVGNLIEGIVEEWDSQKEAFYKQTGISRRNEIVLADGFDELEHLLNE